MKKWFILSLSILTSFVIQAGNETASQTGAIQFIQNNGQWAQNIVFKAGLFGGSLFLEQTGFTWYFSTIAECTNHTNREDGNITPLKSHTFKTRFVGANPNAIITGQTKFTNYYNYFIGKDQSLWQGNVPAYQVVNYQNIYPHINLNVYSNYNSIKYDFIVGPFANSSLIKMNFEGATLLDLDDNGNLIITTSINTLVELKPIAYQIIQGEKILVDCQFNLQHSTVTFKLGTYNEAFDLIIDPATLIFSSYSGSTSDNWGYSATYDEDGNLYGAGIAFDDGYPTTTGAYQEEYSTSTGTYVSDITISKFSPDGTSLIYSTYIGGSSSDLPHSLVVDADNQLVIFGTTGSDDFPVTASAYDNTFAGGTAVTVDYVIDFEDGSDSYITKINATGSALIGSTYLGGSANDGLNQGATFYNYGDNARGEVVVDVFGNSYIASCTNSNDLPATLGAFQEEIGGEQDGFIAKLNTDLSVLNWCTFLGGSAEDAVFSISKAQDDFFYVCGGTASSDFSTTSGALNESYLGGSTDGFIAKLNSDASVLVNATFIGTNQYDQAFFVDVDEENNVYTMGQTTGAYPVVGDVYSNANGSQFVSKLDTTLSTFIYSTVFGSGTSAVNISPSAFLVDDCQNVYVSGWGGSTNNSINPATGNTNGMAVTADAFQSTTSGSDFYFIVFDTDADELDYATFFGGTIGAEHVDGGTSRFDKKGRIYQAVCAGCGSTNDFPTTDGVYSEDNESPNCNLGVIKFEFDYIAPVAGFITDLELIGCSPYTLSFTNTSINAISYLWQFGDGTTSILENVEHTYTDPGIYTVSLAVTSLETCAPIDTFTAIVEVFANPIAAFEVTPNPVSVFDSATFVSLTSEAETWYWSFGDGTTSTDQNPSHNYSVEGTYEVCLIVANEAGCEDSVCVIVTVDFKSLLDIPNAFSPNGDGTNDTYLPASYGMDKYEITIYNRWGEIVFNSSNPSIGWDGKFKEIEQEMDTYVFIVTGFGKDGINYYEQGNVTLIR